MHIGMVEPWIAVAEHPWPHFDIGVRKARRFGHPVCDVDAEAVDAALQPEPQRLFEIVEDLRVVPIEVRLFDIEEVQIPLARFAVRLDDPRPRRPAENGLPIVRRLSPSGSASVAENVAVASSAARLGGKRLAEPRMLRAGVVGHQVHGDLDAALMRGGDQSFQCGQAAEQRIDVAWVRHVVAVIGHGGHHDRAEPDRVDAESVEIVQLRCHTIDVADSVAAAVGE